MFLLYIEGMEKLLLLQSIEGFGPVKIREFLRENRTVIRDDHYFQYLIEHITGNSIRKYQERVKRILDNCFQLGVEIIPTPNYRIIDPPTLLYIKGHKKLLKNSRRLGVVGTREPTKNGMGMGKLLVKAAVSDGWVTVSGLARGCDTLCHRETLNMGGYTIAVLPMGYRPDLTPWILEQGLIVSEYPPLSPIKKYRCIRRNRIISGLSNSIYVMEAYGGGSAHTMEYAYRSKVPIIATKGLLSPELLIYHPHMVQNSNEFDLLLKKMYNIKP